MQTWFGSGTVMVCVIGFLTFNSVAFGEEHLMAVVTDTDTNYVFAYAGSTSGWMKVHNSAQRTVNSHSYIYQQITSSMRTTTGIEDKSISVTTSDDGFSIFGGYNLVLFPLLPVSALGLKYIVSSCHPAGDYTSVLAIATHRHQTDVGITFRFNVSYGGRTYSNGETLNLSLQEYQTFTFKSDFDLSGTVIDAAQTVAVFSGTMYGTMVAAYEQLLPVKHFGQEYVVAVDDNPALYKLQVVSEQSDTKIMFNNGSTVSVGVSGIHSQTLTQNASFVFTTTRPVMTMLCRESSGLQIGFAVVPPVQLYVKQTAYRWFYMSKVLTDRDTDSVVLRRLSAADIPGKWDDIPASRYKVGTWTLSSSLRSITATTGFTVLTFTSRDIYNGGYNFTGSSRMTCDGEHYGLGCTRVCSSRHCEGRSSCAPPVGQCDGGCQSGWTGVDCTVCDGGYYGSNCSKSCGTRHCEGSSSCHPSTGQCVRGCQTGWSGTDCTVCENGKYGDGCLNTCGDRHCSGISSCNYQTGSCDNGCQTGWIGQDCSKECNGSKYGEGCLNVCAERHCSGISSCDHVTGSCDNGCEPGWSGQDCRIVRSSQLATRPDTTVIVTGIVMCLVAILPYCGRGGSEDTP